MGNFDTAFDLAIDQGLSELQADYVEAGQENDTPLSNEIGPGTRDELQFRADEREIEVAQEEQAHDDYVASVRQFDPAPDGSYELTMADGRLEHHETGTGPFAEAAEQFGVQQLNDVVATANAYLELGGIYPDFWEDLEQENPAEYEQAIQYIAMAEQLAQAESEVAGATEQNEAAQAQIIAAGQQLEREHPGAGARFLEALQTGEAHDLEQAKYLALADVDLPSHIAHRALENAENAQLARDLVDAGHDVDSSDWQADATFARALAQYGIDPFDAEAVADISPYVVQTEGDVRAAITMRDTTENQELRDDLARYGLELTPELANVVVAFDGDVDAAVQAILTDPRRQG